MRISKAMPIFSNLVCHCYPRILGKEKELKTKNLLLFVLISFFFVCIRQNTRLIISKNSAINPLTGPETIILDTQQIYQVKEYQAEELGLMHNHQPTVSATILLLGPLHSHRYSKSQRLSVFFYFLPSSSRNTSKSHIHPAQLAPHRLR